MCPTDSPRHWHPALKTISHSLPRHLPSAQTNAIRQTLSMKLLLVAAAVISGAQGKRPTPPLRFHQHHHHHHHTASLSHASCGVHPGHRPQGSARTALGPNGHRARSLARAVHTHTHTHTHTNTHTDAQSLKHTHTITHPHNHRHTPTNTFTQPATIILEVGGDPRSFAWCQVSARASVPGPATLASRASSRNRATLPPAVRDRTTTTTTSNTLLGAAKCSVLCPGGLCVCVSVWSFPAPALSCRSLGLQLAAPPTLDPFDIHRDYIPFAGVKKLALTGISTGLYAP